MQRQGCNQKSEVHQKITSRSLCAPYNLSFSVLMYFICFGTVMAEHTWMGIHLLLPCPFSTWRPGEKHCHIIAAKWILIHTWSALSNFNYLSKFCKKCVFKMFFFSCLTNCHRSVICITAVVLDSNCGGRQIAQNANICIKQLINFLEIYVY